MSIALSTVATFVILTIIVSVASTLGVRHFALRWHILDTPNISRKVHAQVTPLLGGLAVMFAIIVSILVAWPQLVGGYLLPKHLVGLIVGMVILGVGGFLDDRFRLRPRYQIIFPFLASLVIIASGIGIQWIATPLGTIWHLDSIRIVVFFWHGVPYTFTLWSDVLTFVWLMGMMYTTKFLDGLDGLVSGTSVIGASILCVLSLSAAVWQPETALLAAIIGAAFLGFLPWNWHPAKIFLGESGSLLAGFTLGTLAILSGAKVATTFLIFGIPICDVIWVIFRRAFIERRSPLQGDRKHLHQRLLDSGLSHRTVVVFLWALSAFFGTMALFVPAHRKFVAFAIMIGVMIAIALIFVGQSRLRPSKRL